MGQEDDVTEILTIHIANYSNLRPKTNWWNSTSLLQNTVWEGRECSEWATKKKLYSERCTHEMHHSIPPSALFLKSVPAQECRDSTRNYHFLHSCTCMYPIRHSGIEVNMPFKISGYHIRVPGSHPQFWLLTPAVVMVPATGMSF